MRLRTGTLDMEDEDTQQMFGASSFTILTEDQLMSPPPPPAPPASTPEFPPDKLYKVGHAIRKNTYKAETENSELTSLQV